MQERIQGIGLIYGELMLFSGVTQTRLQRNHCLVSFLRKLGDASALFPQMYHSEFVLVTSHLELALLYFGLLEGLLVEDHLVVQLTDTVQCFRFL